MIRCKVTLTQEERTELEGILKKGKHTSLEFRNTCILLNSDESEYTPFAEWRFCVLYGACAGYLQGTV